jgi:hypothetical protein
VRNRVSHLISNSAKIGRGLALALVLLATLTVSAPASSAPRSEWATAIDATWGQAADRAQAGDLRRLLDNHRRARALGWSRSRR